MTSSRYLLIAICLLAISVVLACSSDPENPYDPSSDDPYPNTSIALIPPGGGTQRQPAMTLLNRTFHDYLEWTEGEAIPRYRHPYLSRDPFTAWAVLPNSDMKELFEKTLVPAGIFEMSTPFDLQQMAIKGWPKSWVVVTEQQGRAYIFYDPKEYDAMGKAVLNIPPGKIPAVNLFGIVKITMVHCVNEYPGVNQSTQRGHEPLFRGPGND